ncbi:MAG: glycosyl transferase [Zetaproteobacteria bacterium CG_4_9_14_3_um_filter_49_83]|nr:MAG: glycosyl transferase [Zetaproteobacteria bacterium CG1_02_49_23]PIQ30451.1 MAG: glycosyl transferase [Zetaproteobacteria bacterium CG17_big_fil_post_rev_8_21_14_2_50_50_13]PIY56289.1 MAG: glycosyl transferase [Zetaproteobacteria bacterium CG_4_10_14_0_8_um_filter_49_80]PJA34817.1 MAG: glycosyl transferase [Zetaproteobacteria bacterium CG_4_9_14_3_um_filter_49_83]
MKNKKVAILGTVGVPANYGGFETLVENLVRYHDERSLPDDLTVYCSSKSYSQRQENYMSAKLKYVALHANGAQSIPYDIWGLLSAMWHRADVILQLGVSGAIALPLVRLISRAKVISNIDGIEWRRDKWSPFAKWFLRFSEKLAVRFSHEVIADNAAIADYIKQTYGVDSHVIAYGGDHAVNMDAVPVDGYPLPEEYAFSVCRIEPENNVHLIVEAFASQSRWPLVMVGNWKGSDYGRSLQVQYQDLGHLHLLDPIYDIGKLKTLRSHASIYVHGHSAGGTNPSLVEAMHFGRPVIAFDCSFNRATTEDRAIYFDSMYALQELLRTPNMAEKEIVGAAMKEIAMRRYTWAIVAEQYFKLLQLNRV